MRKIFQNQCFSFLVILLLLIGTGRYAWGAFTLEDEKKLGREIYEKLERNNFLLKDKKLNAYLSKIGNRLLSHSNKAPFDFTFSIFNSSGINAFATPGGYIYINKGLIATVENEAQLAGVMAHEIAHANCRHVASIIEKSQKINLAMLAAVIAGAFLGGGGEASAAIAAFSVAGASSMQLKYQREHEEEADRLGIACLADSGYYPSAMVEFLRIMKQYEFFSKTIPSYLLTHPGTDDRILYLDSLLQTQYRRLGGSADIVGNFVRMQALLVLDTSDLNRRRLQLMEALKKNPLNIDLLYALALTEDQLGHLDTSLEYLQKALSLAPQDEDVLTHMGLVYLKMGNATEALTYLLRAYQIHPENEQTVLALGKAYFAAGDFQNALIYFLKLQDKTDRRFEKPPQSAPDHPKRRETTPDDIDVNYYIAMSYGRLNQQGESHYYFGLYFKNEQKIESALFHFNKALDFYPKDSPKALTIADIIRELTEAKSKKPKQIILPPKETLD